MPRPQPGGVPFTKKASIASSSMTRIADPEGEKKQAGCRNLFKAIGSQVIVEGAEKNNPLNEGSTLWIAEKRSPLGLVDEIFGPVMNPYYVVRYNSESKVPGGIAISFVPEFANHVLIDKNLYKKGCDASSEFDEELTKEAEFSDDEEETAYKRMLKMSKMGIDSETVGKKKNNRRKADNQISLLDLHILYHGLKLGDKTTLTKLHLEQDFRGARREQEMMSRGLPLEQNCSFQPPAIPPDNIQAPQKFNTGASSSHGRKPPYSRGGGRFAGGRGRQPSN
ncbi:hypothetical protein SADUNF_Sadunf19G0105100 [Salix dunnii]|uniref:H/ACA ribonucleoprotein complex subunit n=1 Tax=Salix dunnii TaxID=1413687 RepID=A0A835J336_9ROSI|nr:hypothetical protein SADUNF_Sadunf19G0105100 [Salix dunnii]